MIYFQVLPHKFGEVAFKMSRFVGWINSTISPYLQIYLIPKNYVGEVKWPYLTVEKWRWIRAESMDKMANEGN